IGAGHNTKAYALGYMVPALAGVLLSLGGKRIPGAILFTVAFSLQLMANHLQITYYTLILLVLLGIVKLVYAFREKEIITFGKSIGILILGCVVAIGMNFSKLYIAWEYSKETTRGQSELVSATNDDPSSTSGLDRNYIVQWSYGIDETLTLLIPNFKGGSTPTNPGAGSESHKLIKKRFRENETYYKSISMYHGKKLSTSGPVYLGAIVMLLFVLALFVTKGPLKWWLIMATIVSIVMAWGRHVMGLTSFLLDYLPLYNKFRAPEMILVIAGFTIPLLSFLGLNAILTKQLSREKLRKSLIYSFVITASITLFFSLFPSSVGDFKSGSDARLIPDWLIDAVISDRISMLRSDAVRSFIFISLGAIILYLWYLERLRTTTLLILLGVFISVDLWQVDKRYLNNDNFEFRQKNEVIWEERFADKEILKDKDLSYRTLSLDQTFTTARNAYFHKDIGGYHAAKLRRYEELIISRLNPEIKILKQRIALDRLSNSLFNDLPGLNMLNTRYVIYDPEKLPVVNKNALGNAWFLPSYFIVENATEEIVALKVLDPKYIALIDKRFEEFVKDIKLNTESRGTIKLTEYHPDYLKYVSLSNYEQLAIFSEIYYAKGWKSYIDGKPVPHFRANYVLRAMVVPEGKHTIEFKFSPDSYYLGNKISHASSYLLILVIFGYLFSEFRRRKRGVRYHSKQ
ncbi:MAG: YfhO family protein, partial [Bacteroidetes bacterium]|nr:YfhO family protein [Bacteroidota bacterium]